MAKKQYHTCSGNCLCSIWGIEHTDRCACRMPKRQTIKPVNLSQDASLRDLDPNTRRLVRCKGFDLEVEDHGFVTIAGEFEDQATSQGLGRVFSHVEFIKRFLAVFGVKRISQVNGKVCFVTQNQQGFIRLIEPLFPDEGKAFDMDDWKPPEAK